MLQHHLHQRLYKQTNNLTPPTGHYKYSNAKIICYREILIDITRQKTRHVSAVDVSDVDDDVDLRRPQLEFLLPRYDRRQRNDQEEGAVDMMGVHEDGNERDRLDRLPQPHFIGQDDPVLPVQQRNTPFWNILKHIPTSNTVMLKHMVAREQSTNDFNFFLKAVLQNKSVC